MFGFMFGLIVLCVLFWLGLKVTGAILTACIWLFIKVPLAMICLVLGVLFCITLVFIPIGAVCLKAGIKLLIPGI